MWPTNTHVGGDTTDIGVCATLGMKVKLRKLQLCQLCHTPPSWSTPQGLSCRVLRCQRTPSKSQCLGWLPCELLDQRGEPDQIWILSCREDWWQSVIILLKICSPTNSFLKPCKRIWQKNANLLCSISLPSDPCVAQLPRTPGRSVWKYPYPKFVDLRICQTWCICAEKN